MVEISSLDLHYLINEMKSLEGARIDKIVQPLKTDVFFQFYVSGKGKKLLRIDFPSSFYITESKPATPEKLFGFCSALRKYLSNARLDKIEQIDSERIAKLTFSTKDEKYFLFVEFFSRGNMVLCKEDLTIIVPVIFIKNKEREINTGSKYKYPKKDVNFLKLSLEDVKKTFANKNSVLKILAAKFGFGSIYAKELCILSGIECKNENIDENQMKVLLKSIKSIISKKINPVLVYSDDKIKDAKPFELEIYKDLKNEKKKSFSFAVETIANLGIVKKATKSQKEIARLQTIIDIQESKIKELESSVDKNTKKGEFVYEKYQILSKVLDEINKVRKTHSWKEIKFKLKGHKLIKEVNEKTGEIIVEL